MSEPLDLSKPINLDEYPESVRENLRDAVGIGGAFGVPAQVVLFIWERGVLAGHAQAWELIEKVAE